MTRFRFCLRDGATCTAQDWLKAMADAFPEDKYSGYKKLIARHEALGADDFIEIGRWKDFAKGDKWKENVASVAYEIWIQAGAELPGKHIGPDDVESFLEEWSSREYRVRFKTERVESKRFGLSRATTLLHFMTGGMQPIFDSRVRRAMKRLTGFSIPYTIECYQGTFRVLFLELAETCGTKDLRVVDKALFAYGGKASKEEVSGPSAATISMAQNANDRPSFWKEKGPACPLCGAPTVGRRSRKTGELYFGCTRPKRGAKGGCPFKGCRSH